MILRSSDRRLPTTLSLALFPTLLLFASILTISYAIIDCNSRPAYTSCVDKMEERVTALNFPDFPLQPCTASETKYVRAGQGTSESLECQVEKDVEIVFHEWNFYPSNPGLPSIPNINIMESARITNETDRLTINNIKPGDEGVYVCVATEGGVGPRTIIAGCLIVHATVSTFGQNAEVLDISTGMGDTVILPTSLSFQNAGFCNVMPNYTDARLQHREGTDNRAETATTIFLCDTTMCDFNDSSYNRSYDFSSLGNVTLSPAMSEGRYTMAIVQSCTSTVLSMTYSISFTNTVTKPTKPPPEPTPVMSATDKVTTTLTTPTTTQDPGGISSNTAQQNIVIAVVTPILFILIGALVAVLLFIYFTKRQSRVFEMCSQPTAAKEPVYEVPRVDHDIIGIELPRDGSFDSGVFAPSTIGEDKPNGTGPYGTIIHLNEKPTDQEGFV